MKVKNGRKTELTDLDNISSHMQTILPLVGQSNHHLLLVLSDRSSAEDGHDEFLMLALECICQHTTGY